MSRKKQKKETAGVFEVAGTLMKKLRTKNRASSSVGQPNKKRCHECGTWYDSNRAVCPNAHMHQPLHHPPISRHKGNFDF